MNENLNLCEILKDCPAGTKFWSSVWGDVFFERVNEVGDDYDEDLPPILLSARHCTIRLYANGKVYDLEDAECIIFPSKDQRDWSKFKTPIKKFDPKEFKPFDKVLVRDGGEFKWHPSFLERIVKQSSGGYSAVELIARCRWKMCIPYNDETKCLSWTKDDCPEFYKWWEE